MRKLDSYFKIAQARKVLKAKKDGEGNDTAALGGGGQVWAFKKKKTINQKPYHLLSPPFPKIQNVFNTPKLDGQIL